MMLFLGELKGLTESLKEMITAQGQTLQTIQAQTTEILSLAEVIEESTDETAETVNELAEVVEEAESESDEGENLETSVEVEIPPAPTMEIETPEKPEHKAVSILRKSLLG